MADIAMIVAEEYDRRMKTTENKNNKKMGCDEPTKTTSWLKEQSLLHEAHIQIKGVAEPKTEVGVAALSAFFSA